MIVVKDLVRRYGTHTAVDRLSFTAQPGEIVGLLGPNGAGKTTTMRILTGFLPPTAGSVQVGGFDVQTDSLEVRRRVGYLPERVPVYPDMTVRGYVLFWARLRGVPRPAAAVEAVLKRFDLLDRQHKLVRSLSKGLRQRLGLAQALVHNPPVVILDEPTIGIDPGQVIEVREVVKSLRQEHTVLFSSHILSEVEQVCDRVVILHRGRMVAAGTPEVLGRQMKPGTHLYVALGGKAPAEIKKLLQKLDGVHTVREQGAGFVISSHGERDQRAAVTALSARHGLPLLELRPIELSLEDIFLTLLEKG
ncbi:MAG: ABC transporter ATP-binding protein [Anaerolineae bacterium]|nr:ABC transporter ATP-binding protein [Anaerolineae bacterium]